VGVSVKQVAVVGGGVIGAACARAAAQQGLSVTLFAPGPDAAAASAASAGMLAAQIEPDDEYLLPLAVRGRDRRDLAAARISPESTSVSSAPGSHHRLRRGQAAASDRGRQRRRAAL
jgi:glycine/D-amino acid oxidase-like deaminating enzyme